MSTGQELRPAHQPQITPDRELDRDAVCEQGPGNAAATRMLGGATDNPDEGDGLKGALRAIISSSDDPDPAQHITSLAYCTPLAERWSVYKDGPFWCASFWTDEETALNAAYVRERVNPLAGLERWLLDAPDPEDRARQLRLVLSEVPAFEGEVLADARLRGLVFGTTRGADRMTSPGHDGPN